MCQEISEFSFEGEMSCPWRSFPVTAEFLLLGNAIFLQGHENLNFRQTEMAGVDCPEVTAFFQ